jgi:predicted transcriptional regulator
MKNKSRINIKVDTENGNVELNVLPEDIKNKVPRPGEHIYVITPYTAIEPDDVDGVEILEEDVKGKQIEGYSYDSVFVKASVLSDDMRTVLVNGDYLIPLYKDSDTNRKVMVFSNEEKAIEKFQALMNVSVVEADRRISLYNHIKDNLEEARKKLYH